MTSVLAYMKVDHSPDFKISPYPLLPVKNNPSLLLQLNVARVSSRNVSCSASKSKKLNPTLNGGEKREEKQNTLKNQFLQKIM